MIRRALVFTAVCCALAIPARAADDDVLHVSAPQALIPIVRTLVASYQTAFSRHVEISEISSNAAAAALKAGTINVALSDSVLVDADFVDTKIAGVPFAVIVSPSTGVTGLAAANLTAIFDHAASSWSDFGGAAIPIATVERPRGSAVQRLVDRTFGLDAKRRPSDELEEASASVVSDVRTIPGSIGVVALPFAGDLSGVRVVQLDGSSPDAQAIAAHRYQLIAYEHAVTAGAPSIVASRFVAFVRSRSSDWRNAGFIPMRELTTP